MSCAEIETVSDAVLLSIKSGKSTLNRICDEIERFYDRHGARPGQVMVSLDELCDLLREGEPYVTCPPSPESPEGYKVFGVPIFVGRVVGGHYVYD